MTATAAPHGAEVYRPARAQDRDALVRLWAEAFNMPASVVPDRERVLGLDAFRVVETAAGELAAGGLLLEMGQFFSGVSIPCVGLGAIAVPANQRGRGVARRYLEAILRELHGRGVPISSLYPASLTLYRRVGYDVGGRNIQRDVNPALINVREPLGSIAPISEHDHATVKNLHRRMAERENGVMDRPQWRWDDLLKDREDGPLRFRYLARNECDEPGGYIVYRVCDMPGNYKQLIVDDVCAVDAVSARRLLALLSESRAQISNVVLFGAWRDLLELLTPERVMAPSRGGPWFLRIVELRSALELRRWPRLLSGEVHLRIADDTLPENAGDWVCRFDAGHMTLERGGRGEVQLDIGALAMLYGACWTPDQLVAAGRLNADAANLELLTLLFSGPPAWMSDRF